MSLFLEDRDFTLYLGDALEVLRTLPDESAQCVVTSPPYWGLRDYDTDGQLGREPSSDEYVLRLTVVFREVRRVLRRDGTCWLNVGESYDGKKSILGIPWRLAFALRADGWILRSEIIWHKPNPFPESVTDRPTRAHEQIFLLTRSPRYFYNADAIREPALWERWGDQTNSKHEGQQTGAGWIGSNTKRELTKRRTVRPGVDTREGNQGNGAITLYEGQGRNVRSVWSVPTESWSEAHFATFPQALAERCIKAGTREGDIVLDPFIGSGTTAFVARGLGRRTIGIELNESYADMCAKRLGQLSLLAEGV